MKKLPDLCRTSCWVLLFFATLLPGAAHRCFGEEVLYEQKLRVQPALIGVPVSVDGIPLHLALDTGARVHAFESSMKPHMAKDLGSTVLAGAGGHAKTTRYQAPPMQVGSWTLLPSNAVIVDQLALGSSYGFGVDGILGMESLGKTAIELNFDEGRLRFLHDYQAPASARLLLPRDRPHGWSYVPIKVDGGGMHIRGEIAGVAFSPVLDTGSCHCLSLRHELFEKLRVQGAILSDPAREAGTEFGAGGSYLAVPGRLTAGTLLGIDLQNVAVSDTNAEVDTIGLVFLLQFNQVIDLAAERFYFEPRRGDPPIDTQKMLGTGFNLSEGQYRIATPIEGGPAAQAGLRKNDLLVKLGPLPAKDLTENALYELCETHAGQTFEVEISRDGEPHPIHANLTLTEKQFLTPRSP